MHVLALSRTLFCGLAPLTLAAAGAAQAAYVVDDTPGVDVDFNDLPEAIAAIADGDLLIVRSGLYSSFVAIGKSFSMVAEQSAVARIEGGFSIRGTGPGQSVFLHGFEVINAVQEGGYFKNNEGAIWVEECILRGAAGTNPLFAASTPSFPGAFVSNCAEVVFADCTLLGGFGPTLKDEDQQSAAGDGNIGLWVQIGEVSLFDSEVLGGSGGVVLDTVGTSGGDAGPGMRLDGGFVFASGCLFSGANGGFGDGLQIFGECSDGGNGSSAVLMPATSAGTFLHQDCAFEAGFGGGSHPACGSGQDGLPLEVLSGVEVALPGTARRLDVPGFLRSGQAFLLETFGEPGDLVLLGRSDAQGHLPLEEFTGNLVLGAPLLGLTVFGTVPAGGALGVWVDVPTLPGSLALTNVTLQTLSLDVLGQAWLGHAEQLALLDDTP